MAQKGGQRRIRRGGMQNGPPVRLYLFSKGLYYDFDEPMVLLSDLDSHHPFVKFAKFLIQAVQMNSR